MYWIKTIYNKDIPNLKESINSSVEANLDISFSLYDLSSSIFLTKPKKSVLSKVSLKCQFG